MLSITQANVDRCWASLKNTLISVIYHSSTSWPVFIITLEWTDRCYICNKYCVSRHRAHTHTTESINLTSRPAENISQYVTEQPLHTVKEDVLNKYVPLLLSRCGIVSNLLSMIVFGKLGFKDSMSINIFALSLSNFFTTVRFTTTCLFKLIDKLHPSCIIDVFYVNFVAFRRMINSRYLTSCWITAVMITMSTVFPMS